MFRPGFSCSLPRDKRQIHQEIPFLLCPKEICHDCSRPRASWQNQGEVQQNLGVRTILYLFDLFSDWKQAFCQLQSNDFVMQMSYFLFLFVPIFLPRDRLQFGCCMKYSILATIECHVPFRQIVETHHVMIPARIMKIKSKTCRHMDQAGQNGLDDRTEE